LLDRLNERNGQTLRELGAGLGMARQSVSKHLDVLEAAGLVTTRRQGREKLHFLDAAPIHAIADRWMTRYDRARAAALADLTHALEHSMTTDTFVYTTYIKTAPERVWEALTEPAFTKRYWGVELTSDWEVGSPVTWELDGIVMSDPEQKVLAADPPRTLAYTWHTLTPEFIERFGADDPELVQRMASEPRSQVTFDMEQMGDVVRLTVTHQAFVPNSAILEGVSQGWPPILSSLKTLLETGAPLPA
jgi:uncharacterized protein YndB with AHSA1/START domain/DNA-binding transcriptional ArsR family regulator